MSGRSHIEVGRVKYVAGDTTDANSSETFSVVFENIFKGTPNVSCTVENSNKKAIALNVNSTGFDLIISDSGFEYGNEAGSGALSGTKEFYVHYYAILVG